jgi:hypothetical protein
MSKKHGGTKHRMSKKHATRKHKSRRHLKAKRGGGFIQNALAPLALLGIAQTFSKKHHKKAHKGSTRKNKRSMSRSRK